MATSTFLDIFKGALLAINSYAPGETPGASIVNVCRDACNDLLETWSNEHLTVFNNVENIFPLQAGKASYTIGAGGDFNIQRPLRITSAYTRLTTGGYGSVDYPCTPVSDVVYTAIGLKGQPGPWPKLVYMNAEFPLARLLFWPVPTGNGELHLWTDQLFSLVDDPTADVSLPPGYVRALKKNLALELAVIFGKMPSALLVRQASESKAAVKALNATPETPATFDPAMVRSNANDAGWILHGGFQ